MIRQTDPGFPKHIQRYGCYFLSLYYLFGDPLNRWSADGLTEIYKNLVQAGHVLHSGTIGTEPWYRCYVSDPVGAANFLLAGKKRRIQTVAKIRARGGQPMEFSDGLAIACCRTPHGYHFFVQKELGQKGYNPDPSISTGNMDSYRVFFEVENA